MCITAQTAKVSGLSATALAQLAISLLFSRE